MKQENITKYIGNNSDSFFPRIIREFEDKDEPMIYGRYN